MSDTPNLGLKRPDYSVDGWDADLDGNFSILDGAAAVPQGSQSFSVYTGQSSPWPRTIPNNVDTQVDMRPASDGILSDPLGMLQSSGSYVSDFFGDTYPAGSWMRLGLGMWLLNVVAQWDGNQTGGREIALGLIDDRQSIPNIDPFWWNPSYVETLGTAPTRAQASALASGLSANQFTTAVTPEMLATSDAKSTAGQGIVYGLNLFQNSGSSRTVSYLFVTAVKIAAYPVS